MADIVLIKPPRDADMASRIGLPMSLAYLAGSLRERFSVQILDLQFFQYEQPAAGVEPAEERT